MTSPYRDEVETLRAENARLKRALAARSRARPLVALGLVALDLGVTMLVRPWLNGGADGPFWASLALVVALAVAAAATALGVPRSSP